MAKRKLLWIGDAACQSGFAKCTHETLDVLRQTWDISVLGLNYRGDPHPYPYDIYPAYLGGDLFGVGRLPELVSKINPDLVLVQNDPWNVPVYLKPLANIPVIAAMAVDGKNCVGRYLNGLKLAIFWTRFGLNEARQGGFTGDAAVIPLGVDLDMYKPMDKKLARRILGFPKRFEDKFIVGNVNRNQPRKRLDLTIAYFAEWIKSKNIADAYLFLHIAPTGDTGYDCQQLAGYYGVANRLIIVEPGIWHGPDDESMSATYSAFDVQVNTGQGEGWGLTTLEGMACGVPQIVPDWSALGEWCEDAAYKVECTSTAATFGSINVIGGVADRQQFIDALNTLYHDSTLRQQFIHRGYSLMQRPQYRWPNIGQAFAEVIDEALDQTVVVKQELTSA